MYISFTFIIEPILLNLQLVKYGCNKETSNLCHLEENAIFLHDAIPVFV